MLKILCIILMLSGSFTMLASIIVYKNTLKKYIPSKIFSINRYTAIQILMVFFLIGYIATLIYYIIETDAINTTMVLTAVIFFFGAIFCYSVVRVQSDLLGRLEENAEKLKDAFNEVKTANVNLENLNREMTETMDTLKNTQSQLVFSEKMSVLGKLVAGISHEINTPISVIKASATTLQDVFGGPFPPIFLEIINLSEEDLQDLIQYFNISVINNKNFTTTSEIRILKRNARPVLENAGFDSAILELLEQNYLLDAKTVEFITTKKNPDEITRILNLLSKIVRVYTSVDSIIVSVERVAKIVSSLKTFSHFSINSEKAPFNIITGIETVLTLYINQLKYKIEVVTNFEDVPEITGYEDELCQVWSNLVQNAIYAMESNNTHQGEPKPSILCISIKNADLNRIAVSFSDNGGGINHDALKTIFEPFYTTKPTGIGSGLGLSISKQIVDKHNGIIQVESEEGLGTTFNILLPI